MKGGCVLVRIHCESIHITTTTTVGLPLAKMAAVSPQQVTYLQEFLGIIVIVTKNANSQDSEAHCNKIFVESVTNNPTTATTK